MSNKELLNPKRLVSFIGLIILADLVFYWPRGFSSGTWVVFFFLVFAGLVAYNKADFSSKYNQRILLVILLGLYSMLENINLLNFYVVFVFGLLLACPTNLITQFDSIKYLNICKRFLLNMPLAFTRNIPAIFNTFISLVEKLTVKVKLSAAAAIFTMAFLVIFITANPMVNHFVIEFFSHLNFGRVFFWLFSAVLIFPFIFFPFKEMVNKESRLAKSIAETPIAATLVIFNILFFFQNGSDLYVFFNADGLPAGMTFAEYAHHGAYRLIIATVLALYFLISFERNTGKALEKKEFDLKLLWIVQNIILLGSAVYRLYLYVNAYSLTYLRVYAAIGMLFIFVFFILILIDSYLKQPMSHTVNNSALFCCLIVVLLSFCNLGGFIASYNLNVRGHHDYQKEVCVIKKKKKKRKKYWHCTDQHARTPDLKYIVYRVGYRSLPALADYINSNSKTMHPEQLNIYKTSLAEVEGKFKRQIEDPRNWSYWKYRTAKKYLNQANNE